MGYWTLPADLIVTNARIYTVDENQPIVEAMAIRDGRVVATGPQRGIMTMRGPNTQVLDLHGRTVIPGMIDAHVHLLNLGNSLRNVDLVGTTSYDEVVARVDECVGVIISNNGAREEWVVHAS